MPDLCKHVITDGYLTQTEKYPRYLVQRSRFSKNGSCVVVGLDLCYTVIYSTHQKSGDIVTETVQFYDVI